MLDPVLLELAVLLVEEPNRVVGLLLHKVGHLGSKKGVRGNLLSGGEPKLSNPKYWDKCKIGSRNVDSILKVTLSSSCATARRR